MSYKTRSIQKTSSVFFYMFGSFLLFSEPVIMFLHNRGYANYAFSPAIVTLIFGIGSVIAFSLSFYFYNKLLIISAVFALMITIIVSAADFYLVQALNSLL